MRSKTLPVAVFNWKGHPGRFYGKYRDPGESDYTKAWRRIPGGAYPPEIDTPDKALACAEHWYQVEMAERAAGRDPTTRGTKAWPDVCDAFMKDVKERVRGADSTKDEGVRRGSFLRRAAVFSTKPIEEHDEPLALLWLRAILAEPKKGRDGSAGEPRDPLTVRNIARVLGAIYRFARRKGWFPKDRILPTEGDEFKAELSGALKEKAKLGKEGRVACPTETVRALVHCQTIPELYRVMRRTAFFTGLGPGELHGLLISDYRQEFGVRIFDVRLQWTLNRKDYPSSHAPLKTIWRKRKIPAHPSLEPHIDAWVTEGWKRHVGREPTSTDFLFTDEIGMPFREQSSGTFLAQIDLVNCDTTHKGHTLDLYSLRHSFATIARRAGVSSDARDRLLGHRPKDVKAMHYEDEDLPLLAKEVAKIPPLLDADPDAEHGDDGGSGCSQKPPDLVADLVTRSVAAPGAMSLSSTISAEEVRFELTDPLRDRRFSKPVP